MSPPLLSTATRYFLEVARTGSVSEAAQQVHVAPSAVSRQVAKLEQELGCALFERQARGMVLTEAGERLAAWSRATAQDSERVAESLRGLADRESLRIQVACTEGFADGFMPAVMARFRAAHAGTRIHLRVGAPDDVSRWLQRGEVELGLKFALAPERGLRIEHGCAAPILAVMAPGHALARRGRLRVADLVRHPLALPDTGTTVRQALDLACSQQGLAYELAYIGNFGALLRLAAQGEVVTLSSGLGVAHLVEAGEVVARPLEGAMFQQRRVQLLSLEGQPTVPLLCAFVADLRKALEATAPRRAA